MDLLYNCMKNTKDLYSLLNQTISIYALDLVCPCLSSLKYSYKKTQYEHLWYNI